MFEPVRLKHLLNALNHPDYSVRLVAINDLGKWKQPEVVDALISLLNDEPIRWAVAKTLGRIGDRRAVAPLIEALGYPRVNTRGQSIIALIKIGDKRCIESIRHSLIDPNGWVRMQAIKASVKLRDQDAVHQIAILLESDNDILNRGAAAWALGEIGDHKIVEALQKASQNDPYKYVRDIAAYALYKLGYKSEGSLVGKIIPYLK